MFEITLSMLKQVYFAIVNLENSSRTIVTICTDFL